MNRGKKSIFWLQNPPPIRGCFENLWSRYACNIFIGNKFAFQIVSLYLFIKMKSSSLYLWIYFNEGSRKGALQNPER